MMAIWIKTPPDAEPVWMAADNRIRELALSIERRAGIAPDADGLRQIREWATEIVCQCDMVERVQGQADRRGRASCRMRSCGAAGCKEVYDMTLVELEKIINDAIKESLKEEMEKKQPVIGMSTREAIEKQVPLKIKPHDPGFNCAKCVCGHIFSIHHGNGYYSLPETNYCPDCGQRLLWEE